MKNISYIILSFCLSIPLIIPSILPAQQDSLTIQQKILDSEESDQMFVQRTRNFILNKLKSAEITEAAQAYNYVIQKYENNRIKPFWTVEMFLLCFWFGKYDLLYCADSIENSLAFESFEDWSSPGQYLYPQMDQMALELRIISNQNRSKLMQRIDSLVSEREKHDFAVLFFDWLTFNASDQEMSGPKEQEYLEKNLTPRAEEFLGTYKSSIFRPFVQRHFRYVYVLNDWGIGYCLGSGSLTPGGTAGQYLKPEIILGIDLELSWKSMLIDLGFDVGFPVSIRKPFSYQQKTWNTNIRHNYYTYYIAHGWVMQETKLFKLIPHIGISGINMSVCEGDKDEAGGEFSITQEAIQYGVTCDIKLSINKYYFKENHYSYTGVRIGLDYYQFLGHNPIMSGGMLRFRISWIAFGRFIFRDM